MESFPVQSAHIILKLIIMINFRFSISQTLFAHRRHPLITNYSR